MRRTSEVSKRPSGLAQQQRLVGTASRRSRAAPGVPGLADGTLQGAASGRQVAVERRGRLVTERHDAGLAALAVDQQLAATGVHVVAAQVDELLAAQPAAVEQFEGKAVAQRQRLGALECREDGASRSAGLSACGNRRRRRGPGRYWTGSAGSTPRSVRNRHSERTVDSLRASVAGA